MKCDSFRMVHERYVMRLRKKLQFEERKQANQRRVLSDSESVRWLNHAVERIWPICMEQIASQKILRPIIPWFLDKYRPWTAKKVVIQHLYLGRNPPLLTDIRVLRQSTGDDHLVLELGMNFLTADDMSAILAVKLRKRLGFGMWTKLHLTGMHVEGKVLIGVKFLRRWPFLGRLRVCFAEPPYFQMTVKPITTHGLDVAVLPGIAGWLDKLLSVAFEQTLVEPNMLVVDMEKFVSPESGDNWFFVDEKEPVAHALVEVVEACDVKPSDLNGLADPYVKGQLGAYRFKTKILWKTLAPKWQEEFKIPICTWDSANILNIEVQDKDRFSDDSLGDCSVNIAEFRGGQRNDMWLPLQNIKMGRLHLAITVLEDEAKLNDDPFEGVTICKEDMWASFASDVTNKGSFSSVVSDKSPRVPDNMEPINIEGQEETGIWVHQPGTEVSQIWEPRKGKSRCLDNKIQCAGSVRSTASTSPNNESSSTDKNQEGKSEMKSVGWGLKKIGLVFHKNGKKEECHHTGSIEEDIRSPRINLKALNQKDVGVKFIVEDRLSGPLTGRSPKGESFDSEDSQHKRHMKDVAKSILKHAEKSARHLKHAFSHKGSRKSRDDECSTVSEQDSECLSETSDDKSAFSNVQDLGTLRRAKLEGKTVKAGEDDNVNTSANSKDDSKNKETKKNLANLETTYSDARNSFAGAEKVTTPKNRKGIIGK
ncbi:Calcium-dependent lipid-binding (CaLB domain) family protein [Arabidopsis thaliana]|uniref:Calcium-dependent lipid-binding (CaLB domain) family protein n=1 Tax=Arabidopsis thaliana TaxID=3702 RepID=F4IW75_ARATH|nr:Calcium-dependent lipid-binding (CaLB domain) family protein [Arabidopsis thaliana]AEE75544.1 Calcium-dependent lipid-binding (CaLB domain) family protein [Arabidopsis thaliana]|eukprot:NP_001189894.1 Calcium-dependent lipid-binding (CaLB domain) family protein [Arabidopsis thaliana]